MCIFTIIFLKTVDLACSYDGKYLFTAGGEDCTVNMWNVDIELALLHTYIHNIYIYIYFNVQFIVSHNFQEETFINRTWTIYKTLLKIYQKDVISIMYFLGLWRHLNC